MTYTFGSAERDMLEEISPHNFWVCASDIRMTKFPQEIIVGIGNGQEFLLSKIERNYGGVDLVAAIYVQRYGCCTLTIVND